jgi:hypothetical protein
MLPSECQLLLLVDLLLVQLLGCERDAPLMLLLLSVCVLPVDVLLTWWHGAWSGGKQSVCWQLLKGPVKNTLLLLLVEVLVLLLVVLMLVVLLLLLLGLLNVQGVSCALRGRGPCCCCSRCQCRHGLHL